MKVNEVGFIFAFSCGIKSKSPVLIIVVVLPESTIARTLYPFTTMLMCGMFALIGCDPAISCVVPVRSTMNFYFSLFPKYFAPSMRSGCVPKYFINASAYSCVKVFIAMPISIPRIGTSVKPPLVWVLVRGFYSGAADVTGGPNYSTSGEACTKSLKIAKMSSRS